MVKEMFFPRQRMMLACGVAVALTLRTLVACVLHFGGQCDSNDCNTPHADGWNTAHETHAHVCICEPEPATAPTGTAELKNVPPPFFVARRVDVPQPRNVAWRAKLEKPPPGLVLKKMSQMLC